MSQSTSPADPVFNQYSRYYDLLYKDKDYRGEACFVHEQLSRNGVAAGRLLELGCGTGRHSVEFAELGWDVDGVDLSETMVSQAQERSRQQTREISQRLNFREGDVRSVRTGKQYDAVVSLFHVISYQTSNNDLASAIATAAAHLQARGLFFFDFWFGPAVLSDPPTVRVKRLQDERTNVTRLAEPQIDYSANVVTVNYEIAVENRGNDSVTRIHEQHRMRYLFLPELEFVLNSHGLRTLETGRWMDRTKVGNDTWYVWLLAARKR